MPLFDGIFGKKKKIEIILWLSDGIKISNKIVAWEG